eukprot:TRINITY_DN3656_c0_g1_i1.p1 TRINITY_DN3656_c0_g1~~TRINITY_DN3656_c0_g1_i1.p1  ORF type:complete len:465 (+),score=54.41 TRINITY_DN3656_c0_g1_i1:103-1395(+)
MRPLLNYFRFSVILAIALNFQLLNCQPFLKPNRENLPFTSVLSIDGGGVRAVIPIAVLIELEDKIKSSMVENATLLVEKGVFNEQDLEYMRQGVDAFDIQLADFFDMAAGVSAGSIVAGYFATRGENTQTETENPPGTAKAGLEIFEHNAGVIFKPSFFRTGVLGATYSNKGIDAALLEVFGENTGLSSIQNITFFASSFELDNSRLLGFFVDHVQNNFGSVVTTPAMTVANTIPGIELPDLQVADGEDFRLWEAIRCSAAAPVFLPAHVIHALNSEFSATCVDGALIANNPDMFALTYVNSVWNVSTDEIAILSLGQGIVVRNYAEGGGLDRGLTEWASDLLSIILDGDTETQDVLMDMLYYQVLGLPAPQYLRIQLRQTEQDGELPGIDEFEAIPDLLELGKQLAELYDDYLDQFVAKYLLGTEDVIY